MRCRIVCVPDRVWIQRLAVALPSLVMVLLDAIVRFATVGLLLNLALLAMLSGSRQPVLRIGSVYLLSISAVLINSSSFEINNAFRFVLKVLETPNVGLLWWFGLAMFRDDFRLRPVHWWIMAVLCALGFSTRMHYFGWFAPLPEFRMQLSYVFAFVLMGHLLWSVLRDAGGDLINARRSARFWSVALFVALSVGMGVAEITLPHAVQSFLRAASLLPLAIGVTLWLTSIRLDRLSFGRPPQSDEIVSDSAEPQVDAALANQLQQAIDVDRAYLQQGLTVATLAERIGVPEHRLRAHINQQTGFRNFSAYINHHRIEAAKIALRDPDKTKDGILGIALDAGFASLPTFNRVFKSVEGLTPSDYRQKALSQN